MTVVTLAYTDHRVEALPSVMAAMQGHAVAFLEEAPAPAFADMLAGRVAVDDYLAGVDTEYPAFARSSCRLLRALHSRGMQFAQVEPFIERLLRIHDRLADGATPDDITGDRQLRPVYLAERDATRTLIDYYDAAADQPFHRVLAALKAFAIADARRFRLRDRLRADALARRVPGFSSVYIEAGTMHVWLRRCLKQQLGRDHTLRSLHPMAPAVKAIAGRTYLMGPGDLLTLKYIFHPQAASAVVDRLAAQALIFSKILTKTELVENTGAYPHTRDDWRVLRRVNELSLTDCEALFARIRRVGTRQANALVDAYWQRSPA